MANFFEMVGFVHSIGEVQNKQSRLGSPFQIQSIIIRQRLQRNDGREYDNYPTFEFRDVDQLKGFQVGDEVSILFNIDGIRYTNQSTNEERDFTKLSGFRCAHKVADLQPTMPQQPAAAPASPVVYPEQKPAPQPEPQQQTMWSDDLPF